MPRRKVDPADRLRSPQACVQCRTSKKRCDSAMPCAKCIQRGLQDSCSFDRGPPGTDNRKPQSKKRKIQPDGQDNNDLDAIHVRSGQENGSAVSSPSDSAQESPGEARHRIHPRLLSDAYGEKVFIGSSASLAFLQLIRDFVSRSMGTSDFTHGASTSSMLEVEQAPSDYLGPDVELDLSTKLQYAQKFCLMTKGFIQFIDHDQLPSLFSSYSPSSPHGDVSSPTIARLVLAIGAQSESASTFQNSIEKSNLVRAQAAAFSGMLESPSLETVKVYLLLAFYMLQACRRNAAFMYIGVASRAAYVLGLPNPEYYNSLSAQQAEHRLLVWRSLAHLDIIVSSILGRKTATLLHAPKSGRTPDIFGLRCSHLTHDALNSSYSLSEIVHNIVDDVYTKKSVMVGAAEGYLRNLEEWSDALPSTLRLNEPPQCADHLTWERVIGSLHVSCYYHFAVILVCRPFMISQLVNQLLTENQSSNGLPFANEAGREALAEKCITAAIYMAQTCTEVMEAGFLLDSAPILKAWLFAGGLVLGFNNFALTQPDMEVESAFLSTRRVLQRLGIRSPQASHYYEILGHLEAVVARKRAERSLQSSSNMSRGVDKMINFRRTSHVGNENGNYAPSSNNDSVQPLGIEEPTIDSILFGSQDLAFNYDDILLGWDQVASQLNLHTG